jgi:hypothetical protein
VIDGAPAAHFATTFRRLLESASVLAPPGGALEVASPAPIIGLDDEPRRVGSRN